MWILFFEAILLAPSVVDSIPECGDSSTLSGARLQKTNSEGSIRHFLTIKPSLSFDNECWKAIRKDIQNICSHEVDLDAMTASTEDQESSVHDRTNDQCEGPECVAKYDICPKFMVKFEGTSNEALEILPEDIGFSTQEEAASALSQCLEQRADTVVRKVW